MDMAGTLTLFDAIILIIIVMSMFIGFTRGFTCEILTLGAWGGAIYLTLFAFGWVSELAGQILSPEPLAKMVAGITLFLISIIVLKLIAKFIGDHIKKSAVGALDRSVGAFFGFLRGALVISAAYLALSYILPFAKQPNWITDARFHQAAAYGAEMLSTILPEHGGAEALGSNISLEDIKNQMPVGVDFDIKDIAEGTGYTDSLRDSLSDLIDDSKDEKISEPS